MARVSLLMTKVAKVPVVVALPVGAAAGVLGSLCGIGGGVVILPSLHRFSKLGAKTISAVSITAISLSCSVGAGSYLEQGYTNIPLALTLMSTSVPAAAVGTRLLNYISAPSLTKLTGCYMLMVAPIIYWKAEQSNQARAACLGESVRDKEAQAALLEHELAALRARNRLTPQRVQEMCSYVTPANVLAHTRAHWDWVAVGLVAGVTSGMIGVGGGLMLNMFLASTTTMPQHEIVATSLLVAVPIGMSSALTHAAAGRVPFRTVGWIAGASMVTMAVTSRFLSHLDDAQLKKFFSVVLAGSAVPMLLPK